MPRRPDLFLIGAPRCGTTSLYRYLGGHPDIFMSAFKEPRYFCPDFYRGLRPGLQYGVDEGRYLALFAAAKNQKHAGEGTARYLYSREAPRLISEFSPNPSFVVSLRDPVQMAHSLHWHLHGLGIEPIASFEDALAAEERRARSEIVAGETLPEMLLYRDRARFGEHLERWFGQVSRDRVHVMLLDDLRADPGTTFADVLRFLDVDSSWRPPTFEAFNASHAARSESARRATQSSLARRIRLEVLPRVPGGNGVRRMFGRAGGVNRKIDVRPPLRPETRDQLREELAPDVALTSTLLGRDLEKLWWSKSD